MVKRNKKKNRAIVLFIVLGILLVVVTLAGVILSVISSHSRLTQHQVSRIQAYYATQAGINYALERLRLNDTNWIPDPDTPGHNRTRRLCRSCTSPEVAEPDLPASVSEVTITIGHRGSGLDANSRKITATANYTYTLTLTP